MKKIILLSFILSLMTGCAQKTDQEKLPDKEEPKIVSQNIPYYFIAIHNEPAHGLPNDEKIIENNYKLLQAMIAQADKHGIKLSLMFAAQWADYISKSEQRMSELNMWSENGHEIAAHHHDIKHGNWDGYSYLPEEEAVDKREQIKMPAEPYLGSMDEYIERLRKINPDINSGCLNDESDKNILPEAIIYDTCSGIANYGEPGQAIGDAMNANKGKNEYLTKAVLKGIERKWLANYQILTENKEENAEKIFTSMSSGVYGVVVHSSEKEAKYFYTFLEFLNALDPQGEKSRTLSSIIDEKILPEESLSEDEMRKVAGKKETRANDAKSKKCGDNICDSLEKNNPTRCPTDCE